MTDRGRMSEQHLIHHTKSAGGSVSIKKTQKVSSFNLSAATHSKLASLCPLLRQQTSPITSFCDDWWVKQGKPLQTDTVKREFRYIQSNTGWKVVGVTFCRERTVGTEKYWQTPKRGLKQLLQGWLTLGLWHRCICKQHLSAAAVKNLNATWFKSTKLMERTAVVSKQAGVQGQTSVFSLVIYLRLRTTSWPKDLLTFCPHSLLLAS